jgi:hypothetical protein
MTIIDISSAESSGFAARELRYRTFKIRTWSVLWAGFMDTGCDPRVYFQTGIYENC